MDKRPDIGSRCIPEFPDPIGGTDLRRSDTGVKFDQCLTSGGSCSRRVRALERAKVPYALCGGLAVALHGFPRATKDIDLLSRGRGTTPNKWTAEDGWAIRGRVIIVPLSQALHQRRPPARVVRCLRSWKTPSSNPVWLWT